MRLLGYPASRISVLTTYNGQKALLRDVFERRCAGHPAFGRPAIVTTVDKFQGQQNDYILLSLVRTQHFGHLRDVRRLVVAMSRARLGLYVFARAGLFANCYELQPTFRQLLARPTALALVPGERYGDWQRRADQVPPAMVVEGPQQMAGVVQQMAGEWEQAAVAASRQNGYGGGYSVAGDADATASGAAAAQPVPPPATGPAPLDAPAAAAPAPAPEPEGASTEPPVAEQAAGEPEGVAPAAAAKAAAADPASAEPEPMEQE